MSGIGIIIIIIIFIFIIFIIFIFTSSNHPNWLTFACLGPRWGTKTANQLVLWKSHGQNLCEVKVDVVQWPNAVAPWLRRGNVKLWYRHRNLTMQQICGIWLRHRNWPQKQKIWWWVGDGLGFRASGVPN
jgi:hypothetical protein